MSRRYRIIHLHSPRASSNVVFRKNKKGKRGEGNSTKVIKDKAREALSLLVAPVSGIVLMLLVLRILVIVSVVLVHVVVLPMRA